MYVIVITQCFIIAKFTLWTTSFEQDDCKQTEIIQILKKTKQNKKQKKKQKNYKETILTVLSEVCIDRNVYSVGAYHN